MNSCASIFLCCFLFSDLSIENVRNLRTQAPKDKYIRIADRADNISFRRDDDPTLPCHAVTNVAASRQRQQFALLGRF